MIIKGMYGLGDNIYQRAFIREIKERVYLYTAWPQLYKDLINIKFVKPTTNLRTQNKNIHIQDAILWDTAPSLPVKKIGYGAAAFRTGSILDAMSNQFGVSAKIFDLPKFKSHEIKKPYAIVRPATVRKEWKNIARNPESKYVSISADLLIKNGYTVVSVADLQDGQEWANELPQCDVAYNNGELSLESLMGLVQGASLIVGGVGWIVPAAIACGIPLICILGGHGGHNAPEKITGEPMDTNKTRWIYPDHYCRCTTMLHQCNKKISGFENKFLSALGSLCLSN